MPTISRRTVKALLSWLPFATGVDTEALAELRRALAPKPRRPRPEKAAKRAAKNKETAEIREAVFARANGVCEFCREVRPSELHHVFGRVRHPQRVTNCIAVCSRCHRLITENRPSATMNLARISEILGGLGYVAEQSIAENCRAVLRQKGFGG